MFHKRIGKHLQKTVNDLLNDSKIVTAVTLPTAAKVRWVVVIDSWHTARSPTVELSSEGDEFPTLSRCIISGEPF